MHTCPLRMDNYVTFLAGIFRSVRFGASSAHGQANMVAFNYLVQVGVFSRDDISYYDGIRMKVEKSTKERNHRPIGFIQK